MPAVTSSEYGQSGHRRGIEGRDAAAEAAALRQGDFGLLEPAVAVRVAPGAVLRCRFRQRVDRRDAIDADLESVAAVARFECRPAAAESGRKPRPCATPRCSGRPPPVSGMLRAGDERARPDSTARAGCRGTCRSACPRFSVSRLPIDQSSWKKKPEHCGRCSSESTGVLNSRTRFRLCHWCIST